LLFHYGIEILIFGDEFSVRSKFESYKLFFTQYVKPYCKETRLWLGDRLTDAT